MILESIVALIGALVVRVSTDVATNIENRVINAAIDAVNQKQEPQLSAIGLYMSDLQKQQDEIKALQIREVKKYYRNGIAFLGYANTATDKEQKKQFIHTAIESFTSASNVEVGEAAAKAVLFVGACFYALRCIDSTTPVALENGEYDKAFQLAEQALVAEQALRPGLRFSRLSPAQQIESLTAGRSRFVFPSQFGLGRPTPSRELIEQLLRLPYLQGKYGTFEVYWKKWEPPKLVEPPKVVEALPGVAGRYRTNVFGVYNEKWTIANRGETHRQQGRYEEALADYTQAIALGEKGSWIMANRGETYRRLGRYKEALADFNRALVLDKNEDWYLYGRALVYLLTGEMKAFREDLSSAIKLAQARLGSTTISDSDRWTIGFNVALYYLLNGNAAVAQSKYKELIATCTLLPALRAAAIDLVDLQKVQPQNELAQRMHSRLQTRIAKLKQ